MKQSPTIPILLVDDKTSNLVALEAILESPEYELVRALSGEEAIREVKRRDFAVVLLDVQMPTMDGFDTAMHLRSIVARTRSPVPIIFVTAIDGDPSRVVRAYAESRAVDFIQKPLDTRILRAKVAALAELFRARQVAIRRLRSLGDFSVELGKATTPHEVATVVLEEGMRVAEADTCTLYVPDEVHGDLQLIGHRAPPADPVEAAERITETDSPEMFSLLRAGTSTWAETAAESARLYPLLAVAPSAGKRPRAFWSVPLITEGHLTGLLVMGFDEERRFEPEDRALVETLTRQCAQALRRVVRLAVDERTRIQTTTAPRSIGDGVVEERLMRREADVANRAKDEFLAVVSHELRTPLNAILGWAMMLRRKPLAPDVDRAISIIERNAQRQARLIEDVLDVSRSITGKLTLHLRPTNVAEAVASAVESVTPAATAKQISLTTETDASFTVSADVDRLQQIIWNLLANAVKFTPKGGRVHVHSHLDGSDVCICVEDTGEGIPPGLLPHVFEPFRQADASTTRRHGGLGLGLAIVRQLVAAHGGTIRAESEGRGQGAKFVVALPARAPATTVLEARATVAARPGATTATAVPRLDDLFILIVDDEPDARDLVSDVLSNHGAHVATASSGEEALDMLPNLKPDVIISDIGMPAMDGYAFLRRVRSLPIAQGGRTPALALTAYTRREDAERAFAAGFQMHVTKPAEPHQLVTIIANLAGLPGAG